MGKGVITSGGDRGHYRVDLEYSDGTTESRSAWCADLSEDLTGTVAIAEVPGDTRGVNVKPGWRLLRSQYNKASDGILTKAGDMSAIAAVYNAMITPGWQKWLPTYRYGTIKYVGPEWVNVLLDVVYSEVQNEILPINQTTYLVNVPVEYMDCDTDAFVVGDECLVEFQDNDWNQPIVIGFKEQPKDCFWEPWNGPNGNSKNAWQASLLDDPQTNYQPWDSPSETNGSASIAVENGLLKMDSGVLGGMSYLYSYELAIEVKRGKFVLKTDAMYIGDGSISVKLFTVPSIPDYTYWGDTDFFVEKFETDIDPGTYKYVEIMCLNGASIEIDGIGFR